MTDSIPAGASGRKLRSGCVGWVAILMQTSGNDSPLSGTLPAMSSYKITPSDQISVRESTSRDDGMCSGDMQSGDPIIAAVFVRLIPGPERATPFNFELPKSRTLIELMSPGRRMQNE